jgi:hypothetical protein
MAVAQSKRSLYGVGDRSDGSRPWPSCRPRRTSAPASSAPLACPPHVVRWRPRGRHDASGRLAHAGDAGALRGIDRYRPRNRCAQTAIADRATMTSWPAQLDRSGRVVRCHNCRGTLGRVWEDAIGERHLLLPNSFGLSDGVWKTTRHASRSTKHSVQPFRRRPAVADLVTTSVNEYALEPRLPEFPLTIQCPRCSEHSSVAIDLVDVVAPLVAPDKSSEKLWPLTDPFSSIGRPDED